MYVVSLAAFSATTRSVASRDSLVVMIEAVFVDTKEAMATMEASMAVMLVVLVPTLIAISDTLAMSIPMLAALATTCVSDFPQVLGRSPPSAHYETSATHLMYITSTIHQII